MGATPVLAMQHVHEGDVLNGEPVNKAGFWVALRPRWTASSICRRGSPIDSRASTRPQLHLLQQSESGSLHSVGECVNDLNDCAIIRRRSVYTFPPHLVNSKGKINCQCLRQT